MEPAAKRYRGSDRAGPGGRQFADARAWLEFKSAHAVARDAVHYPFDAEKIADDIKAHGLEVIVVDSAAGDRMTFLQRPDLGRRLDDRSRFALQELKRPDIASELAIVVSDGLSALAVHRHAPTLLAALLPRLNADGWRIAPIVVRASVAWHCRMKLARFWERSSHSR